MLQNGGKHSSAANGGVRMKEKGSGGIVNSGRIKKVTDDISDTSQRYASQLPKHMTEQDQGNGWIKTPTSIGFILLLLSTLIYVGFSRTENNLVDNVRMGLIVVTLCFLFYAILHFRDGPFLLPHPAFWRLVEALSLIYLFGLIFLLFLTVDEARHFLTFFDSSLGVPLPERSYADNCVLYTPNHPSGSSFHYLHSTIFDEFILAHLLGWFAKAFVFRDMHLCILFSLIFEVLEYTLEHQLPNFAECWWDHFILDILICNTIGSYLGLLALRKIGIKEYDWFGTDNKGVRGRILILEDWKRLAKLVFFCIGVHALELHAFYLKFILWVPPLHYLNIARLFVWALLAVVMTREYYQFVVDPTYTKFGSNVWLSYTIVVFEFLVCVKLGKGMFPEPMPDYVFWPWVSVLGLGLVWALWNYGVRVPRERKSSGAKGTKQL